MTLFTGASAEGYPRGHMPAASIGDGPWGEAISYWLKRKGWRQADLVKAIQNQHKNTSKNTISKAVRGFDTTTRVLRTISQALQVPLDLVLVSPDRKSANDARRQMVAEITEQVVRTMDTRVGVAAPVESPTFDAQTERFLNATVDEQRRDDIKRAKSAAKVIRTRPHVKNRNKK
jgi:transcriptional regulator with XRE-family HTH domain